MLLQIRTCPQKISKQHYSRVGESLTKDMNSNAALVCSKAPAAFPLTSERNDILLDWRGLEEMEMRTAVLKRNGKTVLGSRRLLMIMKTQPCDQCDVCNRWSLEKWREDWTAPKSQALTRYDTVPNRTLAALLAAGPPD